MGRQQYLTRLAFGRSALEAPEVPSSAVGMIIGQPDDVAADNQQSRAQCDHPATDAFNAELRKAQNEVLELVGVVERKHRVDRATDDRNRAAREQRQALLAAEHDHGELLAWALLPVSFFSHPWPEAIRQRLQAGFYHASRPMLDIITPEWRSMRLASGNQRLAVLLPGLGDTIAHMLVRAPLIHAAGQIACALQTHFRKRCKTRQSRQRMYTALAVGFDVLLAAVDIALLPIEFYCSAQRLGLAPPLPLFPPLSFFLPWREGSFHRFGWQPLLGLTSPAALLLLHKVIHYDAHQDSIPICSLFTSFRYPTITDHPTSSHLTPLARPSPRDDPLGWLLHQTWSARTSVLQWSGWNVVKISTKPREDDFENDTTLARDINALDSKPPSVHRSTALAHLPAQYLASTLDCFFSRLLTFPIETLMLRSIAHAYMSSPITTKTAHGIEAAATLYAPFGRGPLGHLLRSPLTASSWSLAGSYLSKLGLAMALTTSIDAILFFGVYISTKNIGTRYFEWRRGEPRQTRNRERLLSQGSNASAS